MLFLSEQNFRRTYINRKCRRSPQFARYDVFKCGVGPVTNDLTLHAPVIRRYLFAQYSNSYKYVPRILQSGSTLFRGWGSENVLFSPP